MTLLHERFLEPPVPRRGTVKRADVAGLAGDITPPRRESSGPQGQGSAWFMPGYWPSLRFSADHAPAGWTCES